MTKILTQITKLPITDAEMLSLFEIDGSLDEMLQTVIAWSHINSGSKNSHGLRKMRAELVKSLSILPGITTRGEAGSR